MARRRRRRIREVARARAMGKKTLGGTRRRTRILRRVRVGSRAALWWGRLVQDLDLPFDYPPSSIPARRYASYRIATPVGSEAVLRSSFALLLRFFTGQHEVVIGTTLTNAVGARMRVAMRWQVDDRD